MHVNHPGGHLIRTHYHIVEYGVPVRRLSHGIHGHFPQITRLVKILQGLWRGLLIQREIVNRFAQYLQIMFQHRFA